ncbi:hypothetical protein C1H21_05505 [Xanthomonas arboricola pv. juglandis]|nr:hypothetical protein C1H21_05505 [Xanthomonas arboricola pv. juglandis]
MRAAARPGNRLLGSADILSDSPPRHIPVPLSANPRPRCRSARCFHDLKRSRRNSVTLSSTSPAGARRHSWARVPWGEGAAEDSHLV